MPSTSSGPATKIRRHLYTIPENRHRFIHYQEMAARKSCRDIVFTHVLCVAFVMALIRRRRKEAAADNVDGEENGYENMLGQNLSLQSALAEHGSGTPSPSFSLLEGDLANGDADEEYSIPGAQADIVAATMGTNSLMWRMLSTVGSFMSPSMAQEQAAVADVDHSFASTMDQIKVIASTLDLPAQMPEPFHARLPFRRSASSNATATPASTTTVLPASTSSSSTNGGLKPFLDELELLTFYSKFNAFLKAISPPSISIDLLEHTASKLENMALRLLATCYPPANMDSFDSATSDLDLLLCLDVPAARDLTPFPSARPKDQLIKFSYCQYQFASFLANLSVIPEAAIALEHQCLKRWLDLWAASQDIRLQLLSAKIRHNVGTHLYRRAGLEAGDCSNSTMMEAAAEDQLKPIKGSPKFFLPTSHLHRQPSSHRPNVPNRTSSVPSNPPVVYGPDVFKLDTRDDGPDAQPPEVDVIFVNGMLGSVYHTWRQHDHPFGDAAASNNPEDSTVEANPPSDPASGEHSSTNLKLPSAFPGQVHCWPQAWLSTEFPNARILGINANLKPFLWNPICPSEKIKRRIDQRAHDILQQLLMAGVGQRPIIWISHSAGGILVKEVLRLSATPSSFTRAKSTVSPSSSTTSFYTGLFKRRKTTPTADANSSSSPPVPPSTTDSAAAPVPPQTVSSASSLSKTDASAEAFSSADFNNDLDAAAAAATASVAEQTQGIIFLSVPHRGNQSMMFLYQFPMIFTLTPEAKQLQQNNTSILRLHDWFLLWTANRPLLQVLNMIEDRETAVNRWYSVRLVQYDPQDEEFSDVVLVDTDHTDICKPKSREDDVYLRIVDFIRRTANSLTTTSSGS